jgi:hypothetical protein
MMRSGVGVEACRPAPFAGQPQDAGESGARECIDRVVDGSETHRSKVPAKPFEQILCGRTRPVVCEQAHDRDPLWGHFQAGSTKVAQHRVRPLCRDHRAATLVRTILIGNRF